MDRTWLGHEGPALEVKQTGKTQINHYYLSSSFILTHDKLQYAST